MAVISKLEAVVFQSTLMTYRMNTSALNKSRVALVRWKHTDRDGNLQSKFFQKILSKNTLHSTSKQDYPSKSLSLPQNVEDIDSAEKSRFSPQRTRDISGSLISTSSKTEFKAQQSMSPDARMASYDCTGAVSLSSAMQTNVPDPFQAKGKSTHLNMPGGQWGQGEKYVSEDLNNSHHVNTRATRTGIGSSMGDMKKNNKNSIMFVASLPSFDIFGCMPKNVMYESMRYSSSGKQDEKQEVVKLSRKDQLKRAVKEYGAVVIVFHVGISLMSLGGFYLAVTSGVDFSKLGQWVGGSDGAGAAKSAAPFIVAYAIHKALAPVRIGITLVSVPFIVNFCRRRGWMKPPKPKLN